MLLKKDFMLMRVLINSVLEETAICQTVTHTFTHTLTDDGNGGKKH